VRSTQYQFQVFKNVNCYMSLHRCYLDKAVIRDLQWQRVIFHWLKCWVPAVQRGLSWQPNRPTRCVPASDSLGPGPAEVGQGSLKVLHLWCHSSKTRTPQPKYFFANYNTCWVFWAFNQVCSAYRTGKIPVQGHVRFSCFFANRLNKLRRETVNTLGTSLRYIHTQISA